MKTEVINLKKQSDHFKSNDMNKIKEKTTSLLVQNRLQSLASFSSIEHRLEVIREKNDVLWINDSKSTDMGASCFSLENLHENIIWIVGYDENKRNLDIVTDVAIDKVDQIICYGHFETEIKYHFASKIKYAYKKELNEAIQLAHSNAYQVKSCFFRLLVLVSLTIKILEKEVIILKALLLNYKTCKSLLKNI